MIKDEKFYTWDEIVEKFPGKWVIVEDPELTEAGFTRGGQILLRRFSAFPLKMQTFQRKYEYEYGEA